MPEALDIGFVETDDGLGAKGVAELGLVGFAGAVANALWYATGRCIRQVPITPTLLLSTPPKER